MALGDQGEPMQQQLDGTDESLRRLFDLIRRVNSSTDTDQVLEEIVSGVVEGLGFGLAAISRLDRDIFAVQAYAGPDDLRDQLMGRLTPKEAIVNQFRLADSWGILRYVPHYRADDDFLENAWIPDYVPNDAPDAWHPHDALYAPLYSATGELIGNMAVDFPPGDRIPNQGLRDLLELFVVQAGLALSNAQQRERLAEQVRFSEVVKTVALTSSPDRLDSTLLRSAEALTLGFDAAQTYITCLPDTASLRVEQGVGFPNSEVPAMPDLHGQLDRLGEYLQVTKGSDLAPHISAGAHEVLQRIIEQHGAASLVITPVGTGTEVLGYLTLLRETHEPLREAELVALLESAEELGRAFLNSRLYERELRLVAEFQELDRYKGELIATISHELKTPLTAIVGHSELLDDEVQESKSVQAIMRNAQRLDRLIANLLDYSRVQSKRDQVRSTVNLVQTARSSLDLLRFHAEKGGVDLTLDFPIEPVTVQGDPDEIGRIVDNLIGNAIKYSPAGGKIQVNVRRDGHEALVSVSDNGLGISIQDQARLFSPFHRSSNPEALSIPGTGLGLAISRRIAQAHHGDITVESTLGEGSTFMLRLPCLPSPEPGKARPI